MIFALSFSSTKESDGSYLGRIVWRTEMHPGHSLVVWGYDFSIDGTDVVDIRGPYRVMDNYEDTNGDITYMDLSPDRKTLAYHFFIFGAGSSIRMVNIDACVKNDGCTLDSDSNGLVLAERNLTEAEYVESAAWGPHGERVYYLRYSRVKPEFFKLQYVDLPIGWNGDWWKLETFKPEEKTLVSTLEQPDFPWFYSKIASGIIDESEILTVRISTDSGCGYISFIDVKTCEDPAPENKCLVEPMFFGRNPSLTRQGNVIHNYYREGAPICTKWGGTVGNYDGTEVTKVLKGFMPDAAGGFPWQ
jgi:hypothetical protein